MKYLKAFYENYHQYNLVFDDVDFGITAEELSEVLVDLMDELPSDSSYTYYKGTLYGGTENDFALVFERGINIENSRYERNYQMHKEETIILKHRDEINNKLSIYNLEITDADYAEFDYEYYFLISKC